MGSPPQQDVSIRTASEPCDQRDEDMTRVTLLGWLLSPSNPPPPIGEPGGGGTKECRWTETQRGEDRSGHVDRGRGGTGTCPMKARYCPHPWTAGPCGQPGSGPNRTEPNRGGGHVRLPIPAEHQTTKPGRTGSPPRGKPRNVASSARLLPTVLPRWWGCSGSGPDPRVVPTHGPALLGGPCPR